MDYTRLNSSALAALAARGDFAAGAELSRRTARRNPAMAHGRNYATMSLSELEARAGAGDSRAHTELGMRHLGVGGGRNRSGGQWASQRRDDEMSLHRDREASLRDYFGEGSKMAGIAGRRRNPKKKVPAAAPAAAAPVPAASTPRLRDAEGRLVTKKGTLYKRQKGDAKREREAAWTEKKRAHVERTRRVMSYARDLMQELGWYPGEAIRVAWADEKAGKLQGYVAKTRTTAPEGLFESVRVKNNPFGYDF